MPEMPEVETICNGLRKYFLGKIIKDIIVKRRDLRFELPQKNQFENLIKQTKITSINRRAKYILLNLDDKIFLVIHLGMSARLVVKKNIELKTYQSEQKHTHVIFFCNENIAFEFIDPRRFGFMMIIKKNQLNKNKFFCKLGLEVFDEKLNSQYLYNITSKTRRNIKNLLLDQTVISGIGNIYASEILFQANIKPERSAKQITKKECQKIIEASKIILKNAIDAGGSSLKDFVNIQGKNGYFQNSFKVYHRSNQKCKNIKCNANINRTIISGRASFFCPQCQK